MSEPLTLQQIRITETCDDLKELLLRKNASYGNSVGNPVNIFSKQSREEQIRCRIDDKLSRIMRGGDELNEDTLLDTIGYLILLKIERGRTP